MKQFIYNQNPLVFYCFKPVIISIPLLLFCVFSSWTSYVSSLALHTLLHIAVVLSFVFLLFGLTTNERITLHCSEVVFIFNKTLFGNVSNIFRSFSLVVQGFLSLSFFLLAFLFYLPLDFCFLGKKRGREEKREKLRERLLRFIDCRRLCDSIDGMFCLLCSSLFLSIFFFIFSLFLCSCSTFCLIWALIFYL